MSGRALAFDVAAPVAAVLLLAIGLFVVTVVWPPAVAVESGSMEPHTDRYSVGNDDASDPNGITPASRAGSREPSPTICFARAIW